MCAATLEVKHLIVLLVYKTTENMFQFQMHIHNHASLMCEISLFLDLSMEPSITFSLMTLRKVEKPSHNLICEFILK